MEHQDWKTVVLNKPRAPAQKAPRPAVATISSTTAKPAYKIEQQVDSDTGKPLNYVSPEVAKAIIGGRVAMKLTQKELAQRLNLPEKEVKEIEAGKAVENKAVIARIKRLLGI